MRQRSLEGNILVTGASGVIGRNLVPALAEEYGGRKVFAGFHATPLPQGVLDSGVRSLQLDVGDPEAVQRALELNDVREVVHLVAMLSVAAERDPEAARRVNEGSVNAFLYSAKLDRLVFASSMAVQGLTPEQRSAARPMREDEALDPISEYGRGKLRVEACLDEENRQGRASVAVALRYPGVNAPGPLGDGTTECLAQMMVAATEGKDRFESPLAPGTWVSLINVRDVVTATTVALRALRNRQLTRTVYNIAGQSFTPAQIAAFLAERHPEFVVGYGQPDAVRQRFADSWPTHLDGSAFQRDTGWVAEHSSLAATYADLEDWVKAHPAPVTA